MNETEHSVRHSVAGEGMRRDFFGTLLIWRVRSAETDGAYAVMEVVAPPNFGPPRMHTHPSHETFQILEGQLVFRTIRGAETVSMVAGPGNIVHAPGGVPHVFRNDTDQPARFLVTMAPGSLEGYFLELSQPAGGDFAVSAPSAPPDLALVAATGRKYGIEFADF